MITALAALVLVLAPDARAQSCPTHAETGPAIPSGTRVTVLDVHQDDAYHVDRPRLTGKTGTVDGELSSNGACWFGGSVNLDGEGSWYFYKVAVEAGGASGTWPLCTDEMLRDPIRRGQTVRVAAIHPDDAYGAGQMLSEGAAVIAQEDLVNNGGCWWGGSVQTKDGTPAYLYKVAFVPDRDACPAGALTDVAPVGEPLTVAGIHPDHPASGLAVGDTVRAEAPLAAWKRCWFEGELTGPLGAPQPVRGVALRRGGGGALTCPAGAANGPLAGGSAVRVLGVHVDDPYAAVSAAVVGRVGRLDAAAAGAGCWRAADLLTEGGVRLRFDRVALAPAE
jgi:hypothetical protein